MSTNGSTAIDAVAAGAVAGTVTTANGAGAADHGFHHSAASASTMPKPSAATMYLRRDDGAASLSVALVTVVDCGAASATVGAFSSASMRRTTSAPVCGRAPASFAS